MHTEPHDSTTVRNATPSRPGWLDYGVPRRTNLDQEALRDLAKAHTPALLETSFGSLNKVSRNKSRMAKYTWVISDEAAAGFSHKVMSRAEAQALIDAQAAYIREQGELLELQGYLGVGTRAAAVQWLYTIEGANIAGMQSILAFPRSAVESDPTGPFGADFRVVYTPNFSPDVPGGQRILADLDNRVTYIMGPDYFGESKKAALRMLCAAAYDDGGLVLHAGAKEVLVDGERLTVAILGLSGTGKTTTTFSKQGEGVKPVQDDMVTLWPKGELSVTENGCFAKTFGLSAETEPAVYAGSTSAEAWLENAYQDSVGGVDFFKVDLTPEEVAVHRETLILTGSDADNLDAFISGKVSLAEVLDENGIPHDGWDFVQWTGNGRSIIPLSSIPDAADLHDIPSVRSMGILNRDEGDTAITPGLVRFTSPEQAAGYFMLGETSQTSAAGKERGRIRSPFTQPFFPLEHGLQATRFAELLASTGAITTWLMNTGYVAGDAASVKRGEGLKVKIRHSSAMLEALFRDHVVWEIDPDFGYEVVAVDDPANAALLELVPVEILNPKRAYAAAGKLDDYAAEVATRHAERRSFLEQFGVDQAIIDAVIPA
ncbi:MAG: phosphoenolpyruvate carboxykinase (ATP) [Deltaproteobacteria bacterium]|nr:MAG: phosphoenolpyruvate carboxykinase (ATP) [Deltaproteobacteria bacterium]